MKEMQVNASVSSMCSWMCEAVCPRQGAGRPDREDCAPKRGRGAGHLLGEGHLGPLRTGAKAWGRSQEAREGAEPVEGVGSGLPQAA